MSKRITRLIKATVEEISEDTTGEFVKEAELEELVEDIQGAQETVTTIGDVNESLECLKNLFASMTISEESLPFARSAIANAMAPLAVKPSEMVASFESIAQTDLVASIESIIQDLSVSQEGILDRAGKSIADWWTRSGDSIKDAKSRADAVVAKINKANAEGDSFTSTSVNYLHVNGNTSPTDIIKGYEAVIAFNKGLNEGAEAHLNKLVDVIVKKLNDTKNWTDNFGSGASFLISLIPVVNLIYLLSNAKRGAAQIEGYRDIWKTNEAIIGDMKKTFSDAPNAKLPGRLIVDSEDRRFALKGDSKFDKLKVDLPTKDQIKKLSGLVGEYDTQYRRYWKTYVDLWKSIDERLKNAIDKFVKANPGEDKTKLENAVDKLIYAIISDVHLIYNPTVQFGKVGHSITRSVVHYLEDAAKQYK